MNLLTTDLTSVDVSRPVLEKGGPLRFTVADMQVVKNKAGDKDMIVTTFKSVFPWKSTKGEVVNPGFTVTERLVITATEKKTEESILKDVARLRLSITGNQSGSFMPLDQYIGKSVDALVDVETDETGQYGEQNRLRKMQPAA